MGGCSSRLSDLSAAMDPEAYEDSARVLEGIIVEASGVDEYMS